MNKVPTNWQECSAKLMSQITSATMTAAFKLPLKNMTGMLLGKE